MDDIEPGIYIKVSKPITHQPSKVDNCMGTASWGPESLKKCWRCRVSKSKHLFSMDKNRKDGKQTACKDCFNDYLRARRTGNG